MEKAKTRAAFIAPPLEAGRSESRVLSRLPPKEEPGAFGDTPGRPCIVHIGDGSGQLKSCHYRHLQQRGSASIKAVMPAIAGQGYDGLEVAEDATASIEFVRVHFGDVPAVLPQELRLESESKFVRAAVRQSRLSMWGISSGSPVTE